MPETQSNAPTFTTGKDGKITYTQFGFRSAEKSKSLPIAIGGYLNQPEFCLRI